MDPTHGADRPGNGISPRPLEKVRGALVVNSIRREFDPFVFTVVVFVIGLYGQWGVGKTSMLNLLCGALGTQQIPPTVIWFNPWWFAGENDLLDHFFDELSKELHDDERPDSNVRAWLRNLATIV